MGRLISCSSEPSSDSRVLAPASRKRRVILSIILFLTGLILLPGHVSTAATRTFRQTSQAPLERDLTAGDIHSYRLMLQSGQSLRALFDQRGIDVVVTLYGPDNSRLTEVDNPVGAWGLEPLFFEVKQSGSYKIEVRPGKTSSPPGRYKFSYEARQAMPMDEGRLAAERALATAIRPMKLDSARSLQESLGFGVSKAQTGFQPLAEVPKELRGIIREENGAAAGEGVLPGRIRLDESFTKDELDAGLRQRKYAVVHIASHFKFEPGNETKPFLLLGSVYPHRKLAIDNLRASLSPLAPAMSDHLFTRRGIPQFHITIIAAGGENFAVG